MQEPLKITFMRYGYARPVMECLSYRGYIPFIGELITANDLVFRVLSKNYDTDNCHLTIYMEKQ